MKEKKPIACPQCGKKMRNLKAHMNWHKKLAVLETQAAQEPPHGQNDDQKLIEYLRKELARARELNHTLRVFYQKIIRSVINEAAALVEGDNE